MTNHLHARKGAPLCLMTWSCFSSGFLNSGSDKGKNSLVLISVEELLKQSLKEDNSHLYDLAVFTKLTGTFYAALLLLNLVDWK